jgi:hypothetical protein
MPGMPQTAVGGYDQIPFVNWNSQRIKFPGTENITSIHTYSSFRNCGKASTLYAKLPHSLSFYHTPEKNKRGNPKVY